MEAVLHSQAGNEDLATECLHAVMVNWAAMPPDALARLWLEGHESNGTPQTPFPGAIHLLIHLRPGPNWTDRAVQAGT